MRALQHFVQAQSNLILHFDFSIQEAEQYLQWPINQRYQNVGELHKRKQVGLNASSSSAMPAEQGSGIEARAPAITPDDTIKTAQKAKVKAIKKLDAKKTKWVETLWNNLTPKNIESLLGSPNATTVLFYHKMANGQCLFINLCNQRSYLSERILNSIVKSLHKHPVEAVLHCLTESIEHLLLLWNQIKDKLNIKGSEWFAPLEGGSPFYRLCANSQSLNFLDANWADISAYLDTKGLFAPRTEGLFNGTTAFSVLCMSPEGIALLDRHWDDFKKHINTQG